jgi:hypothetical protein
MTKEEFYTASQGVAKDGTVFVYPFAKGYQPIKEYSSVIGCYYNDDGVNLVHDSFFGKKCAEVEALLSIAENESVDFALHLHGGGNGMGYVDCASYSPFYIRENVQRLKERIKDGAAEFGIPTHVPYMKYEDKLEYPPVTFNIMSAMHHICGCHSIIYESNQGLDFGPDWEPGVWQCKPVYTHEQILRHHYVLLANGKDGF